MAVAALPNASRIGVVCKMRVWTLVVWDMGASLVSGLGSGLEGAALLAVLIIVSAASAVAKPVCCARNTKC